MSSNKNFFLSKEEKILGYAKSYKNSVYNIYEIQQLTKNITSFYDNDIKILIESKSLSIKNKRFPLSKMKEEENGNDSFFNIITSCGTRNKEEIQEKKEEKNCLIF